MNLIYQYWDGKIPPGAHTSKRAMKAYAERIGADYLFEHDTKWVTGHGRASHFYGHFKLIHDDAFSKYDKILFADSDIYPVEGLTESIFDCPVADIGMCEETWQPQNRVKMNGHHISNANDEKWFKAIHRKWGVDLPRTEDGLPKVFNAGLILYTRAGLLKLKRLLPPIDDYILYMASKQLGPLYKTDQCYLHAMVFVCGLDMTELSTDWNSLIHGYYRDGVRKQSKALNDMRTSTTKLVHIQLPCADDWSSAVLSNITNKPKSEWDIPGGYMGEWDA